MPYTAAHKARTRDRIVEAARALFNQRGFVDVSIDDVMAEAGLTRGGFYNHFRDKEELLVASIEAYGQCNPADRWEGIELDYSASGERIAQQMVDAYLSAAHLEDIAGHCPLVALPADAAHAGPEVRRAYRLLLDRMIHVFASHRKLPEGEAMALTAMCVGAMLLSRTAGDPRFGKRMLEAARKQATEMLAG